MVIYYSATGNSKHVAIKLREAFKGDLIDAGDFDEPASFYMEEGETLFLVTFNCYLGNLKPDGGLHPEK